MADVATDATDAKRARHYGAQQDAGRCSGVDDIVAAAE